MNQMQKSLLGTMALFIGSAVAIYLVSGFLVGTLLSLWATLVSWVATAVFIVLVVVALAALRSSDRPRSEPDPEPPCRIGVHPVVPMHRRGGFVSGKPSQTKHRDLLR